METQMEEMLAKLQTLPSEASLKSYRERLLESSVVALSKNQKFQEEMRKGISEEIKQSLSEAVKASEMGLPYLGRDTTRSGSVGPIVPNSVVEGGEGAVVQEATRGVCSGNMRDDVLGGPTWRYRKLDLPMFEGVNPDGWILRLKRYFNIYRLESSEKAEAAVVALERDALLWYQFEHRRRPIIRWEELKSLVLRQFRPTDCGSLYEQWLSH